MVVVQEEAAYKLCKVKRNQFGKGAVPFLVTHDGRTIRYPDPDIKVWPTSLHYCLAGCKALAQITVVRLLLSAALQHVLWHPLLQTQYR